MREFDVALPDGRTLHAYDTGGTGFPVFYHHGTPNLGAPPGPLLADAARLGLRWVSHDRPGYGGSTRLPGRTVASAAPDVAAVADALGIERFAVFGHSGGGSHALACAALSPARVVAAVTVAALAPRDAAGLDWFAGMAPAGTGALTAATRGVDARLAHTWSGEFADLGFTEADVAALHGTWAWFDEVVGPALAAGPQAQADDDVAYTAPWGFDPADVRAPVLLLHGGQDAIAPPAHARWLASRLPRARLDLHPEDGHLSVLRHAVGALEWLAATAG